jgi:phosphoribosylglycinamide formyltransferase-1
MKLGILISGRGSNMVAIAEAARDGRIPDSEVAVVISDQADAPGLARAAELGLPTQVIEKKGRKRADHDAEIVAALRAHGVELVCLAGYMRLLSPAFIAAYRGRILNIHPSLLPAFPGLHAQRQALAHGVKITGCTVHLVDEGLDTGPILAQAAVPVLDSDTEEPLAARILEQEHQLYVKAVAQIFRRIQLENRL